MDGLAVDSLSLDLLLHLGFGEFHWLVGLRYGSGLADSLSVFITFQFVIIS